MTEAIPKDFLLNLTLHACPSISCVTNDRSGGNRLEEVKPHMCYTRACVVLCNSVLCLFLYMPTGQTLVSLIT